MPRPWLHCLVRGEWKSTMLGVGRAGSGVLLRIQKGSSDSAMSHVWIQECHRAKHPGWSLQVACLPGLAFPVPYSLSRAQAEP